MSTGTSPARLPTWLFAAALALAVAAGAEGRVDLAGPRVRAWADELFTVGFEQHRFSGLGLVAVQDGVVTFVGRYGYADYQRRLAIDSSRTQFRIGSITKVFTATAIAQLVERGVIASLDDPANRYLKRVQLPNWHGQEITLWNLLTHRAGFEDKGFGLSTDIEVPVPVSAEVIRRRMPALIIQPGTVSMYSNFGIAVLGIVVEDLTGQTMQEYLRANVFDVLGMKNTVLWYSAEPTADVGRTTMFYPDGSEAELMHSGIHPFMAPAGNLYTTLDDLALFMLAHLDRGRTSARPLMSPAMFETMQRTKVRNQADLSGFGMVFVTENWNGERIVSHGGSYPGYHSFMALFPESNGGIFISAFAAYPVASNWERLADLFIDTRLTPDPENEPGYTITGYNFREMITDRFLGPFQPSERPYTTDSSEYLGSYINMMGNQSQAQSIVGLLQQPIEVSALPGGDLQIGIRGPYRPVRPDLFLHDSNPENDPFIPNPDRFAKGFTRDASGEVNGFTVPYSLGVFFRMERWTQNPQMYFTLLIIAFVIGLSSPAATFWPGSRWRWFGLLPVGALLGMAAMMVDITGPGRGLNPMPELELGRIWQLVILVACANVLAVAALASIPIAVQAWRKSFWGGGVHGTLRRVHFTLIAAGSVATLPALLHFHLLGLQVP